MKYLFGSIALVMIVAGLLYTKGFFVPQLSDGELKHFAQIVDLARGGIIQYKDQHNGQYPDLQTHGWRPLVEQTDRNGNFEGHFLPPDGDYRRGPYITPEPFNPMRNSSKICIVYANPPTDFKAPDEYGFLYIDSTKTLYALNADGSLFDDLKALHR
jgi:hypothetical protein